MSNSTQVAELLQRGIAAAKDGRRQEAREMLLKVTALDNWNEAAWLWLSGVVDSAEDRLICLENVLSINPDNDRARAGLRWLEEQYPSLATPPEPEAEERCPRCQSPVPYSGAACPACGQVLIVVCPACRDYIDVRKTNCPTCGWTLGDFQGGAYYQIALAEAYLEHHHGALAKEAIDRAEAEAPANPRVLERIAALRERMSHTNMAIDAYKRAIERDPENATLYARLGAIYRRRAMPAEARSMYRRAIQLSKGDPAIMLEMARLEFEEVGASQKTVSLLQGVVRQRPDCAEAYSLLGDAYLQRGQRSQAAQCYEKVCELITEDTLIKQTSRRKLEELRPSLPERQVQGWGETLRRVTSLMLLPGLSALVNAQLSPLQISPVAWIMLGLAAMGAYLWVCATVVPRNPATRALFDQQGVKSPRQKALLGIPGAFLWAVALGLILWKV